MRAVGLILIAGCAGAAAPPMPAGPPASLTATSASADDVIVAQVNGRPVWGSCVSAQAARGNPRSIALRECIDFELMAQAAENRGLVTDRDVIDATRTALVNQLVARAYEAKYTRPEDFGQTWTKLVEKNYHLIKHAEYRASSYVRINLEPKATPAENGAAYALADKIASALANEPGLMPPQFVAIAEAVAGSQQLAHADVQPTLAAALVKPYADALWAIPEIGRTSPAVRTQWGWDVVLWTDDVPAHDPTPDELVKEALPNVKRAYFNVWVGKVAQELGVHVEMFKDNIAHLETEVM